METALWLPRNRSALAALALGCLLAELLAWAFFHSPQATALLTEDDSGAWRRRWVAIQRGEQPAHPMIATDRYDAELGWRPRAGLDLLVKGAQVTTNAQGFRAQHDFSPRGRARVQRVVALGDSFTFGEGVADTEAWPQVLDERLPGTEVLNLGVHGYGHDQMLLLLRRDGLDFHPDTVVVGFVALDLPRNMLSFRDAAKPRFTVRDGGLAPAISRVPAAGEILARERWRPRLADLAELGMLRWRQRSGAHQQRTHDLGRELLAAIAADSAAAGATPVFVYLPTGADLAALDRESGGERYLQAVCSSLRDRQPSLVCGTARPALAAAAARGVSFDPGRHWDAAGHAAAAAGVESVLAELPAVSAASTTG